MWLWKDLGITGHQGMLLSTTNYDCWFVDIWENLEANIVIAKVQMQKFKFLLVT